MSCAECNIEKIARHNDALRSNLGPTVCDGKSIEGRVVITRGIAALNGMVQTEILKKVAHAKPSSGEQDHHDERDVGVLEQQDCGEVIWKIDCYSDSRCQWPSDDAADPGQTYRVLTVMLADEW